MFPAATLLREPMVFLTHPLLLHRPQCPEREDAAPWQKGGWFSKKAAVLFLRFQIVSARTPLFVINLMCLSLRLECFLPSVAGNSKAAVKQGRTFAPLSHVQVCPHQPVLSLIMQPQTCTSHTVTQLRRRSSLPWNSCEFSKSTQKSYLFCTFIWDRTSWSKLRNTPAALLGPFSQLENKKVRVGMGGVVFHEVGEGFLQ